MILILSIHSIQSIRQYLFFILLQFHIFLLPFIILILETLLCHTRSTEKIQLHSGHILYIVGVAWLSCSNICKFFFSQSNRFSDPISLTGEGGFVLHTAIRANEAFTEAHLSLRRSMIMMKPMLAASRLKTERKKVYLLEYDNVIQRTLKGKSFCVYTEKKVKCSPRYAGQICDYVYEIFIRKIIKARKFWESNYWSTILPSSTCTGWNILCIIRLILVISYSK